MRFSLIGIICTFICHCFASSDYTDLAKLAHKSPDLKITHRQVEHIGVLFYILSVEGSQPGELFDLYGINAVGDCDKMDLVKVDEKGEICTAITGDTCYLATQNMMVSEPFDYCIRSKSREAAAMRHVVLRPIENHSECGYHLTLEVHSSDGTLFLADGWGFEPREIVWTQSTSEEGAIGNFIPADENGAILVVLTPETVESGGGTFSFEAIGKKGSVKVSAPWGKNCRETVR